MLKDLKTSFWKMTLICMLLSVTLSSHTLMTWSYVVMLFTFFKEYKTGL